MIRIFLLILIFAITLFVDCLTLVGITNLFVGAGFSVLAIVVCITIAFNWKNKNNDDQ